MNFIIVCVGFKIEKCLNIPAHIFLYYSKLVLRHFCWFEDKDSHEPADKHQSGRRQECLLVTGNGGVNQTLSICQCTGGSCMGNYCQHCQSKRATHLLSCPQNT